MFFSRTKKWNNVGFFWWQKTTLGEFKDTVSGEEGGGGRDFNACYLHFQKQETDYLKDEKDTGMTGTLWRVHTKPPERQKTASKGFVNNNKPRCKNHCKTRNKKTK
jgi:hypothetical protein